MKISHEDLARTIGEEIGLGNVGGEPFVASDMCNIGDMWDSGLVLDDCSRPDLSKGEGKKLL